MKVLLYNPPVEYYSGFHYPCLPPLGLAIISRVLNNAGHNCEVYDFAAMGVTPDKITDPQVDVIGFTCPTISVQGTKDCIAQLRKVGYKGRIVVGGIHATLYPEQMLEIGADLVVTGECEGNIVSLLESGATGVHAGVKLDIDDIPMPDWDNYFPAITSYDGQYKILQPRAGVSMWTRGCPYRCIYCANLIFNGQPTRYRSPANIEAEMRYLKSKGIDHVYVYDDELIGTELPEGWMKEVADKIQSLNITWIAQARCSKTHVTLEVLKDMHRAGCRMILWGVESFSSSVLKNIRKGIDSEDIFYSLDMAKQAGIENSLFVMVGNYTETSEDMAITEAELKSAYQKHLVDHMQVFLTEIMPGTELERVAIEDGYYKPAVNGRITLKQAKNGTPWASAATIRKWQSAYKSACPVGKP